VAALAALGRVGAEVAHPHEERRVVAAELVGVLDGLLRQVVGVVAGHPGQLAVVVLHELVVVGEPVARGVEQRPARVAAVAVVVAVERLAEERGVVAGGGEVGADRGGRVEGLVAALGREVRAHAVVLGELAGHQLRAGRAAQRVRGERLGEGQALGTDQLVGLRQEDHLVEALVVGGEQDDVGPLVPGGLHRRLRGRAHAEGVLRGRRAAHRRGGQRQRRDDRQQDGHHGQGPVQTGGRAGLAHVGPGSSRGSVSCGLCRGVRARRTEDVLVDVGSGGPVADGSEEDHGVPLRGAGPRRRRAGVPVGEKPHTRGGRPRAPVRSRSRPRDR
jgi:hypothetical protein